MAFYADRAGRKAALPLSVLLICAGSLILAVVPGYATVGAFVPAILTAARLLQGLSVGGEYGASATYMSGTETRSFRHEQQQGPSRSATMLLFTKHPRETAMIFVITAAVSLAFYCFTTYMQTFLTNTAHFSKAAAAEVTAGSLVMFLLVQPLFGWLGDKVGRRALLAASFGWARSRPGPF